MNIPLYKWLLKERRKIALAYSNSYVTCKKKHPKNYEKTNNSKYNTILKPLNWETRTLLKTGIHVSRKGTLILFHMWYQLLIILLHWFVLCILTYLYEVHDTKVVFFLFWNHWISQNYNKMCPCNTLPISKTKKFVHQP